MANRWERSIRIWGSEVLLKRVMLSSMAVASSVDWELVWLGKMRLQMSGGYMLRLRGGWFANRGEPDLFCEHLQNSVDAVVGMGSGSGGGRT